MRCFLLCVAAVLALGGCSSERPVSAGETAHSHVSGSSGAFVKQLDAKPWLQGKLKAALMESTKGALDGASSRLSADKTERGPAQFSAWIDGDFADIGPLLETDAQVKAAADWVECRLAIFADTPSLTTAERQATERAWAGVVRLIPAFVGEAFVDTPEPVRQKIAETSAKAIERAAIARDNYFDLDHLAMKMYTKTDAEFCAAVRHPRYILDHTSDAFRRVREVVSGPDVSQESRDFFIQDYVDWQSGFVSRAWPHAFAELTTDPRLLKEFRDRLTAKGNAYGQVAKEIRAKMQHSKKEEEPRSADGVRQRTNTSSPAGVPTPPK